jgi:2-amino-4-hydroxy-6-hydroxymethyldihydropteridine diphosphokinase
MLDVILGLGCNIGNRETQLRAAVAALSMTLENIVVSNFYESAALLPPGAPKEWDVPFYNMALTGVTALTPEELLTHIKLLEERMGRSQRGMWGPREIDIDILAMGEIVIRKPEFSVPHKELLNRDFALVPLAEIAPDWLYPVEGGYHGWKAADIVRDKGYVLNTALRNTGTRVHV